MSCITMNEVQQCREQAAVPARPPLPLQPLGRWLNGALLGTAATAALGFVGALALAGHGAPPVAVVELPRIVISAQRLPPAPLPGTSCPVPTETLSARCPLPPSALE